MPLTSIIKLLAVMLSFLCGFVASHDVVNETQVVDPCVALNALLSPEVKFRLYAGQSAKPGLVITAKQLKYRLLLTATGELEVYYCQFVDKLDPQRSTLIWSSSVISTNDSVPQSQRTVEKLILWENANMAILAKGSGVIWQSFSVTKPDCPPELIFLFLEDVGNLKISACGWVVWHSWCANKMMRQLDRNEFRANDVMYPRTFISNLNDDVRMTFSCDGTLEVMWKLGIGLSCYVVQPLLQRLTMISYDAGSAKLEVMKSNAAYLLKVLLIEKGVLGQNNFIAPHSIFLSVLDNGLICLGSSADAKNLSVVLPRMISGKNISSNSTNCRVAAETLLIDEELGNGDVLVSSNRQFEMQLDTKAWPGYLSIYKINKCNVSIFWELELKFTGISFLKVTSGGTLAVLISSQKVPSFQTPAPAELFTSCFANGSAINLTLGNDGILKLLDCKGVLWSSVCVEDERIRNTDGFFVYRTPAVPGSHVESHQGAVRLVANCKGDLVMRWNNLPLGANCQFWRLPLQLCPINSKGCPSSKNRAMEISNAHLYAIDDYITAMLTYPYNKRYNEQMCGRQLKQISVTDSGSMLIGSCRSWELGKGLEASDN